MDWELRSYGGSSCGDLEERTSFSLLSMGAVPSDAVARLMDQNGLMERSHTFKTATKKSAEEESNNTAPAPSAVTTPAADEPPTEEASAEEEAPTEDAAE